MESLGNSFQNQSEIQYGTLKGSFSKPGSNWVGELLVLPIWKPQGIPLKINMEFAWRALTLLSKSMGNSLRNP